MRIMTNETFNFDCVPSSYTLCFNSSCPLSQQCMRHLAGQHVPDHLTRGMAIYPNAFADGKCKYFKQIRVMRAARGFGDIFANVRRSDYDAMRSLLTKCLGTGGTYYRYHSGKKLLTPEQQEAIRHIFRKFGYDDDVKFNAYVNVYDFT